MDQSEIIEALVFVMVTMAAADQDLSEFELSRIGTICDTLPAFSTLDRDHLVAHANACSSILNKEDGLDQIIAFVRQSLPEPLLETAYALAVEVAAVDLTVRQEELRFLQLLRDNLGIDPLVVAAIERAVRVRYRLLPNGDA